MSTPPERVAPGRDIDSSDLDSVDGWYARYVLGVLLLVYICNFVDRQLLAILAEDVKADLGITDAQLGFLFGTAFAVFYATFGIAFGRLADVWNRTRLISLGLGLWSAMTVLSATARGFLPLAAYRFGVGVGEASASPAAFSILYDYFSPRLRTTVLAVYSSGVYLGAGLGLLLGGTVLELWRDAWPDPALAPFGLRGWQAAFLIAGAPGIVLSDLTASLREPFRGQSDGVWLTSHARPLSEVCLVLASMIPVANWPVLGEGRCGGVRVGYNVLAGLCIASGVWGLSELTGDAVQWVALGTGLYAAVSWAQGLAKRDPVVFALIFRCPTMWRLVLAGGSTTFFGVALSFWAVPFLQRQHGVSSGEAGRMVGAATALMGFVGIIAGGVLADWLRQHTPRGKLYVWVCGVAGSAAAAWLFLSAESLNSCYLSVFLLNLMGPMAHGPGVSTINDLMVPRGRATASAFAFMVATFLGTALGPYLIGLASDQLAAGGLPTGEALRRAMLWSLVLPTAGMILVMDAFRHVATDEQSLRLRSRALGEGS